jgi:hypothetical protein
MTALDQVVPAARLVEVDHVDVDAEPARAWADVRFGDLAASRVARALFALRTVADRLAGEEPEVAVRIDDMTSTQERPGFRMLSETPGTEVVVGAIGKVWRVRIPFVHVADAEAFAAFDAEGFVKVAWALRVLPRASGSRVEIEVRVDATDDESWGRFERYFTVIGPASRYIRRSTLAALRHRLEGPPPAADPGGPRRQGGPLAPL